MATWNNGSLRAGQKIRASQGGDTPLSKVVELNGNYRLFFPTFWNEYDIMNDEGIVVDHVKEADIRAAVVPGRTGDYEVVGTSFIPYTDSMYVIDPITEKFNDTTPLEDWSRIARVLFEAQCARAKKNAEAEAERSAKELGRPVDTMSLSKTLEGIELDYHGGRAANGDPIMPKNNPALSSNIVFKISTRVLVVRMNADDTPDWKNARYAVFEVSKARTDELTKLLSNPKHFRGEYLECAYSYTGADKKVAGKNAKLGYVVASDSLEQLFPDEWKTVGKEMVSKIVQGTPDEQVAFLRSRNKAFRGGHTPADIISTYKKWCSTNQAVFGSIDFTDDSVSRNAHLFLENHLVDTMPTQLAEFQRLQAENDAKKGVTHEEGNTVTEAPAEVQVTETPAAAEPVKVDPVAEAAAINMFASGDASNQTLRTLAEQAPNIEIDDTDDLGDL